MGDRRGEDKTHMIYQEVERVRDGKVGKNEGGERHTNAVCSSKKNVKCKNRKRKEIN